MNTLPFPWLSDEELRDLTGYVRPTCQARWLGENGIECKINRLGKVRVMRDDLPAHKYGKVEKRTQPDFSKVRKAS
jgi:hypothetical protein